MSLHHQHASALSRAVNTYRPLRVELLEDRTTPVVFGTPWPDGQHVSLSFAPDNTAIGAQSSNLGSLLNQLGPQSRLDVLRAFQAWAANANVNIGLVSDSGAAFGTPGANQGDSRFGDIRLGGIALAPDVLAITAPYALYDNYAGDIVLNTAGGFGPNGVDLYTALLQESGHAFGVGNSTDINSVMYEYYQGIRTGLSAGDVSSIQALYGVRKADQFEGNTGNNTLAAATPYSAGLLGVGSTTAADLTTGTDVDVYKLTTGLLTNSLTVDLKASGLSLLTAKVEVLDSSGQLVASSATVDPTKNDVHIAVSGVRGLSTYYVRVSAARADAFGIGSYQLDVNQSSIVSGVLGLVDQVITETGLNDTLVTATGLLSSSGTVGPQNEYNVRAAFASSTDVDDYRITVPGSLGGPAVNMLVTIWGRNGSVLNPWVEAYDLSGNKLQAEVLTADGTTTTAQVRGLLPGQTYFIKAFSDTHAVGGYDLAADLRATPVALPPLMSGDLTAATPQAGTTFSMSQTGQAHFVLEATGGSGTAEFTITNSSGQVVAQMQAIVGRTRSVDVFLPAGTYQVSVRTVSGSPLSFKLGVAIVTDPVGATPSDPNSSPQPTSPPPTTSPMPPTAPPPPSDSTSASSDTTPTTSDPSTTSTSTDSTTSPTPTSTDPAPTNDPAATSTSTDPNSTTYPTNP